MLIIIIGGIKGPNWDHVIIVEQKKEKLQVQCKCHVLQILRSSEMCDKFGHKTKETSWPDTDYRSYFIHKLLNTLILLQGKNGTELGGYMGRIGEGEGCPPMWF